MSEHGFVDMDETMVTGDARAMLVETRAQFGTIPPVVGRMAAAPALFRAFQAGTAAFAATSLSVLEQETVILTFARDVGCEVCVMMHQGLLAKAGGKDVAKSILARSPLDDPKLSALVAFTEDVVKTRGDVTPTVWETFLAAGFTRTQALEIVMGIGTYTMSTYANRLTDGKLR